MEYIFVIFVNLHIHRLWGGKKWMKTFDLMKNEKFDEKKKTTSWVLK